MSNWESITKPAVPLTEGYIVKGGHNPPNPGTHRPPPPGGSGNGEWLCYAFSTAKSASEFVADIAEGYRQRGVNYVRAWERPKRKKGGYWVALCATSAGPFDTLAAFYSGRRLDRKDTSVQQAETP